METNVDESLSLQYHLVPVEYRVYLPDFATIPKKKAGRKKSTEANDVENENESVDGVLETLAETVEVAENNREGILRSFGGDAEIMMSEHVTRTVTEAAASMRQNSKYVLYIYILAYFKPA